MTFWKSERSSADRLVFQPLQPSRGLGLELPILLAITAILGVTIAWMLPHTLVMPALSIASFTIAVILGSLSFLTEVNRRVHGLSLWDVAGLYALIWIGTGMLSDPHHVVQLFERSMH